MIKVNFKSRIYKKRRPLALLRKKATISMSNLPLPKFFTYQYTFGAGGGGSTIPHSNATIFIPPFPIDWNVGIDWAGPIKQSKVFQGNAEGYECDSCKDFYPMAELNMPEDSKECTHFRCYGCRKGLITIFGKLEK